MRAILLCLLLAACGAPMPEGLRLATTTSTRDSGLLEWLLPPFEEREKIEVQVIAVRHGPGTRARRARRRGPRPRPRPLARGRVRREGAWGRSPGRHVERLRRSRPASDPAGVKGGDVAGAFRRIAAKRAPFVSRGDKSGTHIREQEIWAKAGGVPRGRTSTSTRGRDGACLVMAGEKSAYILADRGTWLAFKAKVGLEVLVEGDKLLHNGYGAILVTNPKADRAVGKRLLDYLTSPEGQRRIGEFRLEGEQLFHPVGEGQ